MVLCFECWKSTTSAADLNSPKWRWASHCGRSIEKSINDIWQGDSNPLYQGVVMFYKTIPQTVIKSEKTKNYNKCVQNNLDLMRKHQVRLLPFLLRNRQGKSHKISVAQTWELISSWCGAALQNFYSASRHQFDSMRAFRLTDAWRMSYKW